MTGTRSPHCVGIVLLVGMLAIVPAGMLVIGLTTRHWYVAVAAVPMGAFFGCAGRASWVRAQSRVALLAGDLPTHKRLVIRAALWAVAGLVCIALAIVVLNLGD